jgi:CTP synthase
VNVDAGTMNPTEHGEVFVLGDGMECDQDMGNYERFLDTDLTRANYMTTGSVYLSVINRERNLGYKGKFVSVVPYIPMEVIRRLDNAARVNKVDIVITEIGGTAGEYENLLFLEAVKMLKIKQPKDVAVILVSFLPLLDKDNEIKTKPTQHAVRALNEAGIQPDIILARANVPIDKKRRDKLAFHCSISKEDVVPAPNVKSIYDVPLNFEKANLSSNLLGKIDLRPRRRDMKNWKQFVRKIHSSVKPVRIGIVGKYFATGGYTLSDSYISVIEAIKHSAYHMKHEPVIEWLNSEDFEKRNELKDLKKFDGIIVPGGFGKRGIKGKLDVIKYVRENKIPFFGLCYGMQLAVVEYALNVLKLKDATTGEINPNARHKVIDVMKDQKEKLTKSNYGGTMRLGSYLARLKKDTIAHKAYRVNKISERHRHRYEVNPKYIEKLSRAGLVFSGISPDKRLMEIAELPKNKHPFFVGVQFHPEFQARPLSPHPLFTEFIKTCIKMRKKVVPRVAKRKEVRP